MYTAPFDSETLKRIISGELDNIEIDCVNSKLMGKNLLTYLSNLKYKNLSLNTSGLTIEDKNTLVVEYIKHQSSVSVKQIESAVIKAVFSFKGFDLDLVDKSVDDYEVLSDSILSNEEIVALIESNKELFKELVEILDGVLLYAIKNLNEYKDTFGEVIGNATVTDKGIVGKTFTNLLTNPAFNSHYYSVLVPFEQIKYFEYYFDRPIYSGKTLISFMHGDCLIFPLLKMILDQTFDHEQLREIQETADAASI